jgi:predicted DNA-binding protein with PD1-like motif
MEAKENGRRLGDLSPKMAPSVAFAARATALVHVLRLRPGADLLVELREYVARAGLRASFVITCVGSLTRATLRYANQSEAAVVTGHFEICSLVGTMGRDALPHLHISLSDGKGAMVGGGHVLEGCTIYTTAEVVLGECGEGLTFTRPVDPETTWDELHASKRCSIA